MASADAAAATAGVPRAASGLGGSLPTPAMIKRTTEKTKSVKFGAAGAGLTVAAANAAAAGSPETAAPGTEEASPGDSIGKATAAAAKPTKGESKDAAQKSRRNTSILEEKVNVEVLMKLETAFREADTNKGGDLDLDEFIHAFEGVMGKMAKEDMVSMFSKIDANADGTVDWDEFSTFMLLENQGRTSMKESHFHTEYVEGDQAVPAGMAAAHRQVVTRMSVLPGGWFAREPTYATAGRDGTVRFWSSATLQHFKTFRIGQTWVSDVAPVPMLYSSTKLIVVASGQRNLRLYDLAHERDVGNNEVCYELVATFPRPLDHSPTSVHCWAPERKGSPLLAVADDGGSLHIYSIEPRAAIEGASLGKETTRVGAPQWSMDPVWSSQLHGHGHQTDGWITKVRHIPDLAALCTCSRDKTLMLTDLERKQVVKTLTGHTKGVYSFDWSSQYKLVASCGMDRHAILWNPFSAKVLATLHGHVTSILDIVVNDRDSQVLTLGVDKTIKIWDIRNHKCLQTLSDKEMYFPENSITAMMFDAGHRWLVTAATKPKCWTIRQRKGKSVTGHIAPLVAAVYNSIFHQVISADQTSMVCVWDFESGRLLFRFSAAGSGDESAEQGEEDKADSDDELHGARGDFKITALALDSTMRRLITGSHAGLVRVWNFSNGQLLKELSGLSQEVTGLEFISSGGFQNKYIVAVGWDRRVLFWSDAAMLKKVIEPSKRMLGHSEDILSVAAKAGGGVLATGSNDGQVFIWNIESGAVKLRLVPRLSTKAATRDHACEKVIFLKKKSIVLAAAYADGTVRLWSSVDGTMLLELPARHKTGESVSAITASADDARLVTADTAGYIKVWDISAFDGKKVPRSEASRVATEISHWRAHGAGVASLDWVDRESGGSAVLSSAADGNVSLWTPEGCYVGDFGRDEWHLEDASSYRSDQPQALASAADNDRPLSAARIAPEGPPTMRSTYVVKSGAKGRSSRASTASRGATTMASLRAMADAAGPAPEPAPGDVDGAVSPIWVYYAQKAVKSYEKQVGMDERIFLPTPHPADRGLNFPHTHGRHPTSFAHLQHIQDLREPPQKPALAVDESESGAGDGPGRPHTVAGVTRGSHARTGSAGARGRPVATPDVAFREGAPPVLGGSNRGAAVGGRPATVAGGARPRGGVN